MIDGFVEVDLQNFYSKIWPQINGSVDAVHSNLAKFKLGEEAALRIHWGYKDAATGEVVVIAASKSEFGKMDEHWVKPSLLNL